MHQNQRQKQRSDGGTYVLLPLPEASLFGLDLLGEALPQSLLFLLELGVVELLDLRLAVLPGLHLLLAVVLVVQVLSGVDEVQHVSADEQTAELLEVAVVLILDCEVAHARVNHWQKWRTRLEN